MAGVRGIWRNQICPSGPGTELKKILAGWGFKEKGCGCSEYALRMNILGSAWCRSHVGRVLIWLKSSAHKRRLPFVPPVARRLIQQAIKRSEVVEDLRKVFDKVHCVTLGRRADRWKRFQESLPADWPFGPVQRFEAMDGQKVPHPEWWTSGPGAWGCLRSHLRILENALNTGINSVLFLEDDALFPPDFAPRVREFLQHLPDDWGMLYLGGQHLYVQKHPPEQINDWTYRPFNVNRTHAFALRGKMMKVVYRHLNRIDWYKGQHIDHMLGRLHQRREHPIYCPKEWLVGQAEGKSNISGREPPDRFWMSADVANVDPGKLPFVAVLGLHSSGSSALAGVLYHLGVHLGNTLVGYYGKDPETNCGFEAVGLMQLCEGAIPFPAVAPKIKPGQIWAQLRKWINTRRREAHQKDTIAGGKYPQLCQMGAQLINICGDQLRVIAIDRPIEESIESMTRRTGGKASPEAIEAHQRWLAAGKEEILVRVPNHLRVDYGELLADPDAEIARIVEYLGISPTDEQVERAARSVDPARRHVVLEEAA